MITLSLLMVLNTHRALCILLSPQERYTKGINLVSTSVPLLQVVCFALCIYLPTISIDNQAV